MVENMTVGHVLSTIAISIYFAITTIGSIVAIILNSVYKDKKEECEKWKNDYYELVNKKKKRIK